MSGFDSSRRHSATRRRSPPDSDCTLASHGGNRSASAAISSLRSSSQPPTASIGILQLALLLEQPVHLVVLERLGELVADLVEALDQRELIGDAFLDDGAHVLRGIERGLLRQVSRS